jgi:hypothetical protein
MVISGEVELVVSLALVAIAAFIFWRFGIYGAQDHEWVRAFGYSFRWPLQPPRYVQIWFVIALVLLIAGMFLFIHALPRLRQYGLWGLF